MSSEFKYFLIFDGIVVLLLLYWIFKRSKRTPMILKMKGSTQASRSKLAGKKTAAIDLAGSSQGDRSLTVTFNYNGHSFEVFEVLGLPAGSSRAAAEEAYRRILPTIDAESREFLTAAIEALRKNH